MKKQRKKGGRPAPRTTQDVPVLERLKSDPRERRRALTWLGGLGIASLGAVAIARYDSTQRQLHDLGAIGDGGPVVVQVHDPSCPLCRRLMRATRTALESRPDLRYRVADLTTDEGAAFGAQHRAGKVTLLLFDKRGKRIDRVEGVTPVAQLEALFAQRFGEPPA